MTAFVFDIDGTIIDSMPAHHASWQDFFARHALDVDFGGFFARTAGRTGAEAMRELMGPMDDARARALVDEKEALYRTRFGAEFREVPGFAAFARAARADGLALACGTAGDAANIAFAMSHLGMEDFFGAVVGGHEVAHGKPAPDIFVAAARRLGVAPADCIVFEDAPLGIEAARRAGMRAIALTTSLSADDFRHAHVVHVCADYSGLSPAIVLGTL